MLYKCRAQDGRWLFSDRACEGQGARQATARRLPPPAPRSAAAGATAGTTRPPQSAGSPPAREMSGPDGRSRHSTARNPGPAQEILSF